MGKQNLLSVVVADDEQELLGAVCQLIDWEGIGFRTTAKKKSRRRAAIFSRAYSISAALIFRAVVSFCLYDDP